MDDLTARDRGVLSKLEEIEMHNCNRGRFDFVRENHLAQETGTSIQELRKILNTLKEHRLIIWDRTTEAVKSRIGHLLHTLFTSRVVTRTREQRNVADCKYIRYVKKVPKYVIPLDSRKTLDKLEEFLGFRRLERMYGKVVSRCVSALSKRYPKMTRFQLKGTLQTLRCLSGKATSRSIVIVADTGAGKSLAYQLPLLLWILRKKLNAYPKRSVNCTAMLVFPRNVLAQDQYEDILSLTRLLEEEIRKLRIPRKLKDFLSFKIFRDFGSPSKKERERVYRSEPDILITNTETLKRRLLNPLAYLVYKKGIDVVLYDEIHLYYGLHGSFVAGLNARLRLVFPREPIFIGMSATIASPEKHCQRLFAQTGAHVRPVKITDEEDILVPKAVEHHVILKPRPGRYALGVAIDATSCLLHNRRDGIFTFRGLSNRDRPKSISFSDSLDITGRWTSDQNDLELFSLQSRPKLRFERRYPIHFRPAAEDFEDACRECHLGRGVIAGSCQKYAEGRCWYFSNDSGDASRWKRVGGGFMLTDNVRSKRLTSQEVSFEGITDVYELFTNELKDRFGNVIERVRVDNLIATSVIEVGVDFSNINEIMMYGEIRSPTSYKQKAGRGAREENITEGLFILTIIPPLPLANFYYRHFHRLVNPTLSPVPLEPGNPDAIRSHAVGAIFDFLAKQGVDIFNVIEMRDDEASVENEFDRAVKLLSSRRKEVETYVEQFAKTVGHPIQNLGSRAVDVCGAILESLTQEFELKGERKKLVTWLFRASRDPHEMSMLEEKFKDTFVEDSRRVKQLSSVQLDLEQHYRELKQKLSELGDEYAKFMLKLKRAIKVLGVET